MNLHKNVYTIIIYTHNYTLKLFIAFTLAYFCCFSLRGNLDFLQKKFCNIIYWSSFSFYSSISLSLSLSLSVAITLSFFFLSHSVPTTGRTNERCWSIVIEMMSHEICCISRFKLSTTINYCRTAAPSFLPIHSLIDDIVLQQKNIGYYL